MLAVRKDYNSDLTEAEWEIIKDFIPKPRIGGRPREVNMREICNAIFYVLKSGCVWRMLPHDFPNWRTVYGYFAEFTKQGVWSKLNDLLTRRERERQGRFELPTLAIADSQSVRCASGKELGYDGAKKIRGRKRHIVVDTLGLLCAVVVGAASVTDARGATIALERMSSDRRDEIEKIIADKVYGSWPFADLVPAQYGIEVEIIDRKKLGTNMKPKRWIVERTFAWMNNFRRLAKDFERTTASSESFIYLAMSLLILKRWRK